MKIQTKVFNYGNEHESDWPPQYGTGEKGIFHIENGECKRGYPAPKVQKFGEAPYVIGDEMKPYYHPGICKVVESRSALKQADEACGTITTDKFIEGNRNYTKELERKRKEDAHKALRKAVAQIDAGDAPLNEKQRAMCERKNEIIAAAMPGFDPYNAVGRISNAKGIRYKRKHRI